MALTEIYVDPSLDAGAPDSGTGAIGDPFSNVEYAVVQTTFDATNGTRVNIKAGTDNVLTAELSVSMENTSVSIAWAPTESARCVFEGYTSAAGDLGQGGISGGGLVSIYNEGSGKDYITFKNLHLHNTGSNTVVSLDDYSHVINCEVNNGTGIGIQLSILGSAVGNYIYNVGLQAILTSERCSISYNFIEDGVNALTRGIEASASCFITRNIISMASGSADGIEARESSVITHNSIYSDGGTGQGIVGVASQYLSMISNNLVEGFSGSGGIGIDLSAATCGCAYYAGNAVYNCETEYGTPTIPSHFEFDNESLTVSPFTDPANGDFQPIDTGNVKEGSVPSTWNGS